MSVGGQGLMVRNSSVEGVVEEEGRECDRRPSLCGVGMWVKV